jgi:hypothetical protein
MVERERHKSESKVWHSLVWQPLKSGNLPPLIWIPIAAAIVLYLDHNQTEKAKAFGM